MDNDSPTLAGSDGVSVHSGFPNPAVRQRQTGNRLALDLNQLLIRHPSSSFLFRISGHSWADQGIYDGDVAVVDRALAGSGRAGDLVVTWPADEPVISRRGQLEPSQPVWGVVTAVIHQYQSAT